LERSIIIFMKALGGKKSSDKNVDVCIYF
jgi:hypothetical protein